MPRQRRTMTNRLWILLALFLAVVEAQKDPNVLPGRSAIVTLFEWKWTDIANECEQFLGPRLYAGVQVSPASENLAVRQRNRPWWERYQPVSYRLITRSGDEAAFADMVKRCNDAGIRVYVDVVLNHMTGSWVGEVGTGGSEPDTFNLTYPDVPYGPEHFHEYCVVSNYQDPDNVRNCDLIGLHDLNQSMPYVQDKMAEYMNHLVDLGVAGFRIDSAKHMNPIDLEVIFNNVNDLNPAFGFADGSRPFFYQVVIDLGNEAIRESEYTHLGRVVEFKYCSEMGRAFNQHNPLKYFYNFGEEWGLAPEPDALVFVDNHDNQRGAFGFEVLSFNQPRKYNLANAFMLAWPYGFPRVMSSFSFTDKEAGPPMDADENIVSPTFNDDGSCNNGWVCEHRWRPIYAMVQFRNVVEGTNQTEWWDNGNNQIAFCRGNKGFVAINDDTVDLIADLQTCLAAGIYCDVISGEIGDVRCSGRNVTVTADGTAHIEILVSDTEGVFAIHELSRIY